MAKTITEQQKLRLTELRTEYEKLMAIGEELFLEAQSITNEPEPSYFTWDYVANDFLTIDKLLKNLHIKVE
jgi:hypothetical protein